MTQTELSVTDVTAIKITRSSVVNALHIKLETRGEAVEVTAYAARDLERLVHGQGEQGIPIVFDESEGENRWTK